MAYKPTLGGLKTLQNYLERTKFSMPIIKTEIYSNGKVSAFHDIPGNGNVQSIDELINVYGQKKRLTDVIIESIDGKYFLQFTDLKHLGPMTMISLLDDGFGCAIEGSQDPELRKFIEQDYRKILNLARRGKEKFNLIDNLSEFFESFFYMDK